MRGSVSTQQAVCPVFVSRERELAALRDALLGALQGDGGMVLLAGDAGIGKTRLARELADWARGVGATALSGGCAATELALPYLPFVEALGNYVARTDLDSLRRRLAGSSRDLGGLFPRLGAPEAEAAEPTHAKLRLYEAILRLLEAAGGDSGLLLVVEDLHQADASTRELLDYLARRLPSSRILVLATYRPDEIHRKHPLLPDIQRWRRTGLAQVLTLQPLDADAAAAMVDAILGGSVEAGTAGFLHQRSEGNPFVLEELLRESLDRGDVYRTGTGWERRELTEFRLPETVRDAILLRVERLEPEHVRMLRSAAVLGESFQGSILAAVAGLDERHVRQALAECINQQLLTETQPASGSYRFRHALTQEAVYQDLVASERQEYHRRAAVALEAAPASSAVEVARHLLAAGEAEAAVPRCLQAARQAEETWAFADAAELYERALPYIHDPTERASVLRRLGWCLTSIDRPGASSAAERHLQDAVDLLERTGDATAAARVRVTLALARYPRLRGGQPERELREAVDVLEPSGPSAELAEAFCHLALFRAVEFDSAASRHWAERAREVAEAAGADVARVRAQHFIGLALAMEGHVEEALGWLDRSLEEADRRGWSWYALTAITNTQLFLPLERWHELPRRLAQMRALGPEDWATFECHSWAWIGCGLPARAAEVAERARQAASSRESTLMLFWANCALARAYASRGRVEEARRVLPPPASTMHKQDQLLWWGAALHVAVVAGERDRVRAGAGPTLELVAGWPGALESVLALHDLVDGGEVVLVANLLQGLPDASFFRGLRIDVAAALGEHSHVLDRAPAFIELADRVGAPLFADRARLALAGARAASGDTAGASALLKTVIGSAGERQHLWQRRQALELADRLGLEIDDVSGAGGRELTQMVGERLVTVLFADVRGYTAMTRKLAPAVMAEKIAAVQRAAAQQVARHNGSVDKFAGDAVMATFNASGSSLAHAEDALKAAIALRQRAARLGLEMGIGVATGGAIVGRLAEGANVSVLGDATNLASRLQAEARAGEILISDETWRHLTAQPEAKVERLRLKGFQRAVKAYRLKSPGT